MLLFLTPVLINPKPKLSHHSFECLVLSLPHQSNKCQQPILFAVVYRAPGAYSEFLTEFPEFLSNLVLKTDKIIIVGDFNIHVDNTNDSCSVGVGIFTVCETERFGGKQTKEFHFPLLEKPPPPSAHRTPVVTPATP